MTSDEVLILGHAAPAILRMLKEKEEKLVSKMYGEFRSGKVDHISSLAELACLRDLTHEINRALTAHQQEKTK